MGKRIIIVGGVAGGASAATRLRRLDEDAEIIIFEKGGFISFANCGLPYYIGDVIKERNYLLIQTPEEMYERFRIDVRIYSEVTAIDTENKTVTVTSKEKGIYKENYDNLILSPGAKPFKPNIPGIDDEGIFALRNISDTDAIKKFLEDNNPAEKGYKSALVIGGGFIGVEMAENLAGLGMNITLVEAAPHILVPFDEDMVLFIEEELAEKNINLILNKGVKAFDRRDGQFTAALSDGTSLKADMAILAIGVKPDTDFLLGSRIELGSGGHIIVNEKMETSVPGIYAAGDAVEVTDYITGLKTAVPLAGPANKQGRIAADNIAGLDSVYEGAQGTSILKVFDLTAACTGANERALIKANIKYHAIFVHPLSHAAYYPGSKRMTLKLLFSPEGKVLGAQGIGYDGVDKRIDVIAAVIRMNGTVKDLTKLELSYAPPYSSAKDPVNMAGYVAENVISNIAHMITWKEVSGLNPGDYVFLDVRTVWEYRRGHLKGAINIPVDELRERLDEVPKDKLILAYCQVGYRGYIADRILSRHGFNVKNITGGYHSIYAFEKAGSTGAQING